MELLCIKTHPHYHVVAGKTYIGGEIITCSCGSKSIYIKNPDHFKGANARFCNDCKTYMPSLHFFAIDRFVEIGTEDEHSTYEQIKELCHSNK